MEITGQLSALSGSTSLGSNTKPMKQTELQSTRQTGSRAGSGEASPYAWKLVALLSLGGCFEIYNLALTATLSPGLIRSGIFHEDSRGLWGTYGPSQLCRCNLRWTLCWLRGVGGLRRQIRAPHDLYSLDALVLRYQSRDGPPAFSRRH